MKKPYTGDETRGVFRDWIPADEDPGAFGEGGFQDFVPTPEPKAPEKKEEKKKTK